MNHTYPMESLAVIVNAPTALAWLTASIFTLMAGFYVIRSFYQERVSDCCGYYSPWQEAAHILCATGMVAMSIPRYFLFIPPVAWVILFGVISVIYVLKALLWTPGTRPGETWCMVHAGIFAGMAYMFYGPLWAPVSWGFVLIYACVILFFLSELLGSIGQNPIPLLALGAEIFHILMAMTMIGMFLFPDAFMPGMAMCISPR